MSDGAIVGPGALVSGGNRQFGSARVANSGGVPSMRKTGSGSAHGMGDVILRGGMARHGVRRVTPTEKEREDFATIRKTGKGDRVMVPEVVGEAIIKSRSPWVRINELDRGISVKVYRECSPEAQVLVWNGRQLPDWMVHTEGKAFSPPPGWQEALARGEILDGRETTKQASVTLDDDDDEPLIGSKLPTQAPDTAAAATDIAPYQRKIAKLEAKLAEYEAAEKKRQGAFTPCKAIIDIEGFGEVETTVDWYQHKSDVLIVAYDGAAKRNILNPKPQGDQSVAQFIMEIHDGSKRHVFELAAVFDSRFSFPARGEGITFQQFLILRHESVQA